MTIKYVEEESKKKALYFNWVDLQTSVYDACKLGRNREILVSLLMSPFIYSLLSNLSG